MKSPQKLLYLQAGCLYSKLSKRPLEKPMDILVSVTEKENSTTPTKESKIVSRGPKKNFLARQAALDAKLNVLRIRAQAEKSEDSSKVSLEMSDDEVIQHQ